MMSVWPARLIPLVVALAAAAAAGAQAPEPSLDVFARAGATDPWVAREAIAQLRAAWRDGYAGLIIDMARFLPSPRAPVSDPGIPPGVGTAPDRADADDEFGGGDPLAAEAAPRRRSPEALARERLTQLLERATGQRFGDDLRAWRRWLWSAPREPHPDYARFKADLYARIDPTFKRFFPPGVRARIRLDEVDWGGVAPNGIPPLRQPKVVPAGEASWLKDDHVVFGITIDGEARAYPRRILAWHELATDRLGGVDLTIVYCTLCGTVIPYESRIGDRHFRFGTSGLLYRSNKLMFDEQTYTLWSTLDGTPVVGALADSGLRLAFRAVVTTTWREWRAGYPHTTVLSLDTGFDRDYREGVAYKDYFATDRLMFEVPARDERLKNKAEIVALRPEVLGGDAAGVALAVDMLRRLPVYAFEAAGRRFVALTTPGGASRVYDTSEVEFPRVRRLEDLRDRQGGVWQITDDALIASDGRRLPRVPTHRAFWFGWIAQFPGTLLLR